MKLSATNYPILRLLNDDKEILASVLHWSNLEDLHTAINRFGVLQNQNKARLKVFSKNAANSVRSYVDQKKGNAKIETGTYFFTINKVVSAYVHVSLDSNNDKIIEIFMFNETILEGYVKKNERKKEPETLVLADYVKTSIGEVLDRGINKTLLMVEFILYARLEEDTKKVKIKGQKIRRNGHRYTPSVEVDTITTNHYTTIYVEGEFGVKGHWRNQPKKKLGQWTKELIWIHPFKKNGYTRKADLLKQKEIA